MPRRQGSILDNLIEAPWWASVVLAVGLYVLLKFLVPLFASSDANFALKGIIQAAPQVAWLSFILLLATPLAAYRQWRERRLLDKQEDLATIRALTWRRFETLVAEAYRRQGYEVFRPSGNGPDGGVDLVLKKDGNTILVQCKQWRAWKVGVKVVRELYGVMTARRAQGAILVTSGIFTHDARTFAAGKPLDLVEGAQLAELIRSVQSAPAPPHRSAELPQAQAPEPATAPAAPSTASVKATPKKVCPKCGAEMVLRTAQRGQSAGQQFWGCSRFPACRATEPVIAVSGLGTFH